MYSFIISGAAGIAAFLAVNFGLSSAGVRYPWAWAIAVGLLAGLACYLAIMLYVNRQLKARLAGVETALAEQRVDLAISRLEEMRTLSKWQPMINKVVDGQVGVIVYAYKQDPVRARPMLENTLPQNWHAKIMLAAIHYQNRNEEAMKATFEDTLKATKKEGLLWSAYAWCEWKRGHTKEAIDILGRARKELPDDEAITRNLQTLQSSKKMKMSAYEPEWYLFGLERPPAQMVMGGQRGGGAMGGRAMGGGRRFRAR